MIQIMKTLIKIVDVFPFRLKDNNVEFLVLQMNPKTKNLPLEKEIWQVVHGSIKPGEKADKTAIRELKEETRLEPLAVYQLDDVHVNFLPNSDSIYLTPVFAIECPNSVSPTLSSEHINFRWVEYKEAEILLRFAAHRRVLGEIEKAVKIFNFENLWKIQ